MSMRWFKERSFSDTNPYDREEDPLLIAAQRTDSTSPDSINPDYIDDDYYALLGSAGDPGIDIAAMNIEAQYPKTKEDRIQEIKDWAREHKRSIAFVSGSVVTALAAAGLGLIWHLRHRADVEIYSQEGGINDGSYGTKE